MREVRAAAVSWGARAWGLGGPDWGLGGQGAKLK